MLQKIVDLIVYSLLGLDPGSKLADALNFFLYDSIKILLLMFFMIAFVGFFRTYLSQEKIRKILSGKREGVGNFFASLLGSLTHFCSCSSIPIFLGFLEAGVPLGVTFSFLITSPLVNEYLAIVMFGLFGWKITLAYIIGGILIGMISGMILGKMGLEKYLIKDVISNRSKLNKSLQHDGFKSRILFGLKEATSITKKLWIWILVGVGIGALLHNYVPQAAIESVVGKSGILGVPAAVLLGVPIYGSCVAILPIAVVLFQKGFPLGTALAFMMAISALSLPEAIILKRVMKFKLIAIFFGIVALGIIFTGYLFNILGAIL